MRKLTLNEILAIIGILMIVLLVTWSEMRVAIRRARDAQRRVDIGVITNALHTYRDEMGFVPFAQDGFIKACKGENFEIAYELLLQKDRYSNAELAELMSPCPWGASALKDITDDGHPPYIVNIPQDPSTAAGISYLYLSNGNRFQIYAYLEGEDDEAGYGEHIVARNLMCGNKICSFGKAYGNTPIDKSIEEYEVELLERGSRRTPPIIEF